MRVTMRAIHFLMFFSAICAVPVLAQNAAANDTQPRGELALEYTYLHSNLPPGGCGCFAMNGGSAQFAWPILNSGFSVAADATIATQSNTAASGYSLTLSTFTAGTRYRPAQLHGAWQPFGELLAGGSHASGTLASGANPAAGNASFAFAMMTGGGIDLRINSHFSLRLAQADYLLTTFDNGSNNHQNNLRLSAGVVLRFGH
ncbi:MAG: outer membrane beta-barrel protein [Acidobacteriaceae bacterium]